MARKPMEQGPKLEALLDERDRLRVTIKLAEDAQSQAVSQLTERLHYLEQTIERQWGDPKD